MSEGSTTSCWMGAGTYPSEKTSGAIVHVRTKLSGRRSSLAWLHEQASFFLLPRLWQGSPEKAPYVAGIRCSLASFCNILGPLLREARTAEARPCRFNSVGGMVKATHQLCLGPDRAGLRGGLHDGHFNMSIKVTISTWHFLPAWPAWLGGAWPRGPERPP